MDRRALSTTISAAALSLSWLVAGTAGAENWLDRMQVLLSAVAEPAPDVPFTSMDGRQVRLRDLSGRPVLLGFFTTW